MLNNKFLQYRGLACILLLFSVALGIRLLYQKESVVNHPIRADAMQYFCAAFNLQKFGVYSNQPPPQIDRPPTTPKTGLNPGYPVFLTLLMQQKMIGQDFLDRVMNIQGVMGALTAVLTFLIARMSLTLPWAIFAGALCALSPHLIALEGYLLTESLFTFLMVMGAFILILSWKNNSPPLTFIAGLIIMLSAHVKETGLLLLLFLAPVYLLHPHIKQRASRSVWLKHLLLLLVSFTIVATAYTLFKRETIPESSIQETSKYYNPIKRRWPIILASIHPPDSYITKRGIIKGPPRIKDVEGDYFTFSINRFLKYPLAYLKWNFGGKLILMWRWDHLYYEDVYVYPMLRKGFHVNGFLMVIHKIMFLLHWPLYVLALAAPVIICAGWRRGTISPEWRMLLVPVLGFLYFLFILVFSSVNPRYAIPARPFSYILAAASLSWLIVYFKTSFVTKR